MGQFFSLKNTKFFSGLKKLPHSGAHYYYCVTMDETINVIIKVQFDFCVRSVVQYVIINIKSNVDQPETQQGR